MNYETTWAGSLLLCSSKDSGSTRQLSEGRDFGSITVQKGNGSLFKGLLRSHLEYCARQHLATKNRPSSVWGSAEEDGSARRGAV